MVKVPVLHRVQRSFVGQYPPVLGSPKLLGGNGKQNSYAVRWLLWVFTLLLLSNSLVLSFLMNYSNIPEKKHSNASWHPNKNNRKLSSGLIPLRGKCSEPGQPYCFGFVDLREKSCMRMGGEEVKQSTQNQSSRRCITCANREEQYDHVTMTQPEKTLEL